MHRLLKRQYKKAFPEGEVSESGIPKLLKLVNNSYLYFDEERKLSRRAEEISSEELKKINRELEEKNAFLDDFNHGLAHDAKNHTANLKGLLRMMTKYQKLEKYDKMDIISQKLELSVNQMTRLLDGFLYLSSAEGFLDSRKEIIDVQKLKEEINLEIEYLIAGKGYQVNYELGSGEICYSKHILRVILVNLISNSLKFAKQNVDTVVNVSIKNRKGCLEIIVKDNGIGMDLEDSTSTMFKLFDRRNKTKHIKGYGIGLFMIKNILDRNNGEIVIESELRKGTEIKIKLPY